MRLRKGECPLFHGRAPLLSRNFHLYLVSRFCAATAMTMLRAAVAWHVFDLSRSAFHLGLIGLVQFAPAIPLTLLGGAVADARDRRTIMLLAQTVSFAGSLALFALAARNAA